MTANPDSVIEKLRKIIVFDAILLGECIEDVIDAMDPTDSTAIRRAIKMDRAMEAKVRRLACDLSVSMTLAKTLQDEQIFSSSLSSLYETDFTYGRGLLHKFALAYMGAESSSLDRDSLLSDCLPRDMLKGRMGRVNEIIDKGGARTH